MGGKSGYSPFIFQLQEAYPILIGDLDPSGNLQANIIHAPSGKRCHGSLCANHSFVIQRTKTISLFTDNLRTKMMVAIMEGKWQNVQMTADYKVQNENKCLCAFPQLFAGRVETTQPPWLPEIQTCSVALEWRCVTTFRWCHQSFHALWRTRNCLLANNTDIDCPASFSDLLLVLQSVTSKLSLGAELAYQAAPQIPGGHIGVLSGVARWRQLSI